MTRRQRKPADNRRRRSPAAREVNLLLTCVGRRIELIDAFRRAADKLKITLVVHGADKSFAAPAMHHVDVAHLVPPLHDNAHLPALESIIQSHGIDMLIPLIDSELSVIGELAARSDALGCRVIISSDEVIKICQDKLRTYQVLKAAKIDTPATWPVETVLRRRRHRFPYFLKPREGSAGLGNYKIHSVEELVVFSRHVPDPIVQEFVDGEEHTLDVYTGFDSLPRCVVPRKRIEVRSGEVSKGITVKNRRIMAVGKKVASALPGCRGVITVQCIVTPERQIRVIEINPRFGGGVPLAIHCGADFPRWLLAEHLGRHPTIKPDAFANGVMMLRYDQSVFCTLKNNKPAR